MSAGSVCLEDRPDGAPQDWWDDIRWVRYADWLASVTDTSDMMVTDCCFVGFPADKEGDELKGRAEYLFDGERLVRYAVEWGDTYVVSVPAVASA